MRSLENDSAGRPYVIAATAKDRLAFGKRMYERLSVTLRERGDEHLAWNVDRLVPLALAYVLALETSVDDEPSEKDVNGANPAHRRSAMANAEADLFRCFVKLVTSVLVEFPDPTRLSGALGIRRSFSGEWFKTRVLSGGLRESQIESDSCVLRSHLKLLFGATPIDAISVEMVDRYLAQKRVQVHQFGIGYSPATLRNQLSLLRRILTTAQEYERIAILPVLKRHWPKASKTVEESRP